MPQIPISMEFIDRHTKSVSTFYSQEWLNLITIVYRHRIIPILTTNQVGQVTGFLPLCLIQSSLTGRRLIALPYTEYCPLLASDEDTANKLINQALDFAQQQKVRYL